MCQCKRARGPGTTDKVIADRVKCRGNPGLRFGLGRCNRIGVQTYRDLSGTNCRGWAEKGRKKKPLGAIREAANYDNMTYLKSFIQGHSASNSEGVQTLMGELLK